MLSDVRAFCIAGDWKATVLTTEVWVDTVTQGERRFMTVIMKEEIDAGVDFA